MSIRVIVLAILIIRISYQKSQAHSALKVAGGHVVKKIEKLPFQVAFLYEHTFKCGGSIINEYWIVTAAHCTHTNHDTFHVRAGSIYKDKAGILIKAEKFIEHPQYNEETYNNDIALIKLSKPLTFNGLTIQPAKLNTKDNIPKNARISGWGYTVANAGYGSEKLQIAKVDVFNSNYCTKHIEDFNTTTMICAGKLAGGIDTCDGDSGGPLSDNMVLYGIVSHGAPSSYCAQPNKPGVYTKISHYINFIKKTIAEN